MEARELKIAAPWGHIAVRLWGDDSNQAILAIHGILDNVGTFDRLIPLLPPNYYYICIDLPGHGMSSHWPPNVPIHTMNNLLVYKIVVDYFKRKSYILLGHSYGGQLAFTFTQLYPEHVKKLIMLDTIYTFPYSVKALKEVLLNHQTTYFANMEKLKSDTRPEYTYEDALARMMENRRHGKISREAAVPLLKRMIVPQENGKVQFTVDPRLKNIMNYTFDFRYMADFIKKSPVLCPVLIILASESDMQQIYFKRILNVYRTFKNIKIKIVDGNHDVHNIHPERVASKITKFLMINNKL